MALSPREVSKRRAERVRTRLKQVSAGRPRLSVFRSSKNIYAQLIDDENGVTLVAASSLEGEGKAKRGSDKEAAAQVGKPTEIKVAGIDKQLVGETAARIRKIRPPEPYKGKGVRYAGEAVRRKEGKKK